MKRSYIIFLISFLATAGIMGGYFYYINKPSIESPATAADSATEAPQKAADATQTPAASDTTQKDTADKKTATTSSTDTPATPETDGTQQPTGTTKLPGGFTYTPGMVTPAELQFQQGTQQQTTEKKPTQKPLTAQHQSAREVVNPIASDNAAEYIAQLIENKQADPQAAAVITEWLSSNKADKVEEIGDTRNYGTDTKTYRYRVTTENGTNDLLVDVVAAKDGSNAYISAASTTSADKTQLTADSDPMTVAEGFIQAVREGNMTKARSIVNSKTVSAAALAGLCMIFEEGTFILSPEVPIRSTVVTPQSAMFLVYVVPADTPNAPKQENNNIALSVIKTDAGWQVSGVSTDKLLNIYLMGAQKEGGRYFPIVKNPKGGESLALYFDFDDSSLTPRSDRQLKIVADILRESKGKLDIAGHTDDLGTEEYNIKLSERRAESVRQTLIKYGVDSSQITTKGLGKNEPRQLVSESDNEEILDAKRGENRRAEIYLDFES